MLRKIIVCAFLWLLAACTYLPGTVPPMDAPGPAPSSGVAIPTPANLALVPAGSTPVQDPQPQPSSTNSVPEAMPAPDTSVSPGAAAATPAPRSAADSVSFAVIGDFGLAISPGEAQVAALVQSWNPDLIITVGDNNYTMGSPATIDQNIGQYYHSFINPYSGGYGPGSDVNRFFPTLGNHDWNTEGATPYLDYFDLPGNERYYDFTWGPVHFFALDSNDNEPDGVSKTSVQAKWLRERLAASTSCWNLVYFHHPPFSSGPHASSTWMRWPFKEWGANAVFSGHDHIYERVQRDDFTYFINGLGGSIRYELGNPVGGSQVRYQEDFGAMRVTATSSTIAYEFIALDGHSVDRYEQNGSCPQTH